MLQFTDMMGQQIQLHHYPKRIISVVPSQTEFLFSIGLEEEVIGITKFCIHPASWFATKQRIGGTKTLNIAQILSLNPDIIIANKEENTQEDILALQQHIPVWISDIETIEDAYTMMLGLGALTNKQSDAESIVASIKNNFDALPPIFKGKKVAYFIWRNPYMAAAQHTFIHQVLEHIGAINAFAAYERYPEISEDLLMHTTIDILLLSSEPYPFKEQHIHALQNILPRTKIILVDGEMFSWYGSRMLHVKAFLEQLEL